MVFSDNKQNDKRRGATVRESSVTILTSGCHFSGKLYCRGSSRIGGQIEGEIVSEGMLIIEEEAKINADIVADEVIIQGSVKGRVESKVRVELAETCRFEGDLITPSLVVFEGAKFNGNSTMVDPTAVQKPEKAVVIDKIQKKSGKVKIPEVGIK